METKSNTSFLSTKNQFSSVELDDSFYDSMLFYSLRHITFIGNISHESTISAIQKSLRMCQCIGINSKHHFKQIFVFDKNIDTLLIDWHMSKTGFKLMLIEISSADMKLALWLWKLANSKTLHDEKIGN